MPARARSSDAMSMSTRYLRAARVTCASYASYEISGAHGGIVSMSAGREDDPHIPTPWSMQNCEISRCSPFHGTGSAPQRASASRRRSAAAS